MSDEHLLDNLKAIYLDILNALPEKKENVRKVMIKFTMSKPIVVEM